DHQLPMPDFIIGDVGSTIYRMEGGRWSHWQAWEGEIAPDWGEMSRTNIETLLCHNSELRLQEPTKQNSYKLSYYFPLDLDITAVIKRLETTLKRAGVKASLITSIDEPAAIGLLDILPERATKCHAIEFLMAQLGFGLDQTIFAGDSGNDIPVLISPINAILVANADSDLCSHAQHEASLKGNGETLYCATGGYLEMNGNYSAGILEGVAHYLPNVIEWLR
ncbi:MAG: HAD hydrolase family protein, partial [Gammaproteobacteria bacterium]|nr:HAD hydrolase family protein [Gammaproteobacteria bacterium]